MCYAHGNLFPVGGLIHEVSADCLMSNTVVHTHTPKNTVTACSETVLKTHAILFLVYTFRSREVN